MSKALVIKGANFSTNKVETITLSDSDIPCTGISLSESTESFTDLNQTVTLTATVTPADTTDEIYWESSDTDVVTVVSGVVTCVGVGIATITAICGDQSATCAVSALVTYDIFTKYSYNAGSLFDKMSSRDYVSAGSSANYVGMYSATNDLDGYRMINSNNSPWDAAYPIAIPKGTNKITVTTDKTFYNAGSGVGIFLLDANTHQEYSTGIQSAQAKTGALSCSVSTSDDVRTYVIDLDAAASGVTGYNSMAINLRTTDISSFTHSAVFKFEKVFA